ncbi:MAG: hypothetical protein IPJ65_27315 [Archangiaceae bacterium]|nr:hypothetical protein [Archangiaceae bacterium]
MVSQAPALNALVVALQRARIALQGPTGTAGRLELSRRNVAQARAEFSVSAARTT